jgi:hypothetical protein
MTPDEFNARAIDEALALLPQRIDSRPARVMLEAIQRQAVSNAAHIVRFCL